MNFHFVRAKWPSMFDRHFYYPLLVTIYCVFGEFQFYRNKAKGRSILTIIVGRIQCRLKVTYIEAFDIVELINRRYKTIDYSFKLKPKEEVRYTAVDELFLTGYETVFRRIEIFR